MSEQNIRIAYHWDEYGVYDGQVPCQESPREPGKYLVPGDSTLDVPPTCAAPYVARWNGTSWEQVEDHRRHLDDTGTPAGGTPYWMPSEGDTWRSEPRYMEELGPLPEGAVTTCPAKTAEEIQQEQLQTAIYESQNTLRATDYRVIKFMDKIIKENPELLAQFNAEYPDTLEERQNARDTINGAQATALAANISL